LREIISINLKNKKMEITKKEMIIKVEYTIDYDAFESLIITALEGGINYWGGISWATVDAIKIHSERNGYIGEPFSVRFAKFVWDDNVALIVDVEQDCDEDCEEEIIGKIDLRSIKKGWQIFSQQTHHFNDFLNDDADAITADVWFQCCSLGDVVYG
jgi:hypothetical protein